MPKKSQNAEKEAVFARLCTQFDAVVDGFETEVLEKEPTGDIWRRFLKRNYQKNFPARYHKAGQTFAQDTKHHPEKVSVAGIKMHVATAQAIVAALSIRIDHLTEQLRDEVGGVSTAHAIIEIHDCCRIASLFAINNAIACAPKGWTLDAAVLQQRSKLIGGDEWPLSADTVFEFIQAFGDKVVDAG